MADAPEARETDCACPANARIERHFDARTVRLTEGGQLPGLVAVSERLRDGLIPLGPAGESVLELGCGRGGLLLELVEAGASRATGVDLSRASIEEARGRFERAGLSERVDLSVGDAAGVGLEPHDWVILDRVICCYPELERLLSNTLPAARRIYAFSVPTSRGWRGVVARLEEWFENAWNTMLGKPCPGYVHDLDAIERQLSEAGFRLRHQDRVRVWHIAIYERATA